MTERGELSAAVWVKTPAAASLSVASALAAFPAQWLSIPAVAAAAGTDLATAAQHLATLSALGLATAHGPRYRLASPALVGAGPADDAAVRGLADWYLLSATVALNAIGMAEGYWPLPARPATGPEIAPPRFADADHAHLWLLDEQENLQQVTAAAGTAGLSAHAWQLAVCQLQAWSYRNVYELWDATAETALREALAAGDPIGHAQALAYQARGLSQRGLLQPAEQLQQRALEIRQKTGDLAGLAQSHNALGLIAHRREDLDTAISHYLTCEEIAASCGSERFVAVARHNRGDALRSQGDLEQAMELLRAASEYYERHGVLQGAASIAQITADVLGLQGHVEEALAAAKHALEQSALLPNTALLAWAQRTYALALSRAGQFDEAIDAVRAAVALYEAASDAQRSAKALDLAADLYEGQGQAGQAAVLRAHATELRSRLAQQEADSRVPSS